MHLTEQRGRDCLECIFISDAQALDKNRLHVHTFEHARDLNPAAVHQCRTPIGHAANFLNCLGRIFEEGPADFNNPGHQARPAEGSHPNMRLRFWTACPAAPFTRLSSTDTMTVFSPLATTPMEHRFVFVTL